MSVRYVCLLVCLFCSVCSACQPVMFLMPVSLSSLLYLLATGYFFSHLSSHAKKRRCQSTPFCGFNTQWFSSGKMRSSAGMLR